MVVNPDQYDMDLISIYHQSETIEVNAWHEAEEIRFRAIQQKILHPLRMKNRFRSV